MAKLRRHLWGARHGLTSQLRLDLFAGRCGVVACRFRSLSISPSFSCSIRCDRESQFTIATRQRRIYTYVRLRTARGITQTRGVRRNALAAYENNTYAPLENMSIKGKCRNRSDSNAVPRSWTLLPSQAPDNTLLHIIYSLF